MKATIASVNPEPRLWEGEKGVVAYISGTLADGSRWSRGTKPEQAAERIAAMQALVGRELDLALEDRGERNGVKEYRLMAWPDKPQGGGGGARTFKRDPEALAVEQERMDRRTALMQAVALCGPGTPAHEVIVVAEELYDWLRENVTQSAVDRGAGAGGGEAPAPSPAPTGEHGGDGARQLDTDAGDLATPAPSAPAPGGYAHQPDDGHAHTWTPAPRPGWQLCSTCGRAERRS